MQQVITRLGIALGHDDATGNPPDLRVRWHAALLTPFGIERPVRTDVAGLDQVGARNRYPPLLPRQAGAARLRRHNGDGNRRVRLLGRFGKLADAELEAGDVL